MPLLAICLSLTPACLIARLCCRPPQRGWNKHKGSKRADKQVALLTKSASDEFMFEHCLYFNTTALARQLEREWTGAFKPFGLTPSQAFMLRVILEKKSITATDLSRELTISKATCSRTLEGLIELGLVKRIQAESDGRSQELHPSAKARLIRDPINHASGEVTKKIKKLIGSDEFETIVTKLRGISVNLK